MRGKTELDGYGATQFIDPYLEFMPFIFCIVPFLQVKDQTYSRDMSFLESSSLLLLKTGKTVSFLVALTSLCNGFGRSESCPSPLSPAWELCFGQSEGDRRCVILLENVPKNPVAYKVMINKTLYCIMCNGIKQCYMLNTLQLYSVFCSLCRNS